MSRGRNLQSGIMFRVTPSLRKLADEMDDIAVTMDYYGGFTEWSRYGREIAGAGKIARQWAGEIEATTEND